MAEEISGEVLGAGSTIVATKIDTPHGPIVNKEIKNELPPVTKDLISNFMLIYFNLSSKLEENGINLPAFLPMLSHNEDFTAFQVPFISHELDKEMPEFTTENWIDFTFDICVTLDYLYLIGVVNLDVKLENIGFSIDASGALHFKIIDTLALIVEKKDPLFSHLNTNFDKIFTNGNYIKLIEEVRDAGLINQHVMHLLVDEILGRKTRDTLTDQETPTTEIELSATRQIEFRPITTSPKTSYSCLASTFIHLINEGILPKEGKTISYLNNKVNKFIKQNNLQSTKESQNYKFLKDNIKILIIDLIEFTNKIELSISDTTEL